MLCFLDLHYEAVWIGIPYSFYIQRTSISILRIRNDEYWTLFTLLRWTYPHYVPTRDTPLTCSQ